jgi:Mrp family chromosome partitioning ATPase
MAQQAEEVAKQVTSERERLHPTSPDVEEVEEEERGHRRRVRDAAFRNPDAKLVLSEELQTRHVVFSERHVGEIHSFPVKIEEKLEQLGMFNDKYPFQYMRKPHTVIRPHTGLVARRLLAGSVEHMDTRYRRVIVAGEGGTGKSFILMQIAAAALMKDYIVIAVPRGPLSL